MCVYHIHSLLNRRLLACCSPMLYPAGARDTRAVNPRGRFFLVLFGPHVVGNIS